MQMGELVLRGTVVDVATRSGVKDGRAWEMTTAYIPGRRQVFAVTLGDDLVNRVHVGETVELVVTGRTYNGRLDWSAWAFADDSAAATRAAS